MFLTVHNTVTAVSSRVDAVSISPSEKHPGLCQHFQLISQTLSVEGLTSTNTFVTSTSKHVSSKSCYIRPAEILIILNTLYYKAYVR